MTSWKAIKKLFLGASAIALCGCSSIAKGVTEAILDPGEEEQRLCKIEGDPFDGIHSRFEKADLGEDGLQTMRMLIVHGIGEHPADYSRPFVDSVARGLDLTNRAREQKRINLRTTTNTALGPFAGEQLGWLLISRYTNDEKTRELLTFEVNWSEYHEEIREDFVEDDRDVAKIRASINESVKTFFNKQVVDPIKYIGDTAPKIRAHVRQASCWMVSADWNEYPNHKPGGDDRDVCYVISKQTVSGEPTRRNVREIIDQDEFVGVTHSLGSRIFLDAFTIPDENVTNNEFNPFNALRQAFSGKDAAVFMLSNQLPLLQLGFDQRGFSGLALSQEATKSFGDAIPWRNNERYSGDYEAIYGYPNVDSALQLCQVQANRRFRELAIVTINDPNDLLSYSLPEDFKNDYIDWALCPTFTDLTIEVVSPANVLGLSFADPAAAHGNYWSDQGLARLLIKGFGREDKSVDEKYRPERNPEISIDARGRKIEYKCEGRFYDDVS